MSPPRVQKKEIDGFICLNDIVRTCLFSFFPGDREGRELCRVITRSDSADPALILAFLFQPAASFWWDSVQKRVVFSSAVSWWNTIMSKL